MTRKSPIAPVVKVDNLRVAFTSGPTPVEVVKGISFTVQRGESVAIVGESGSGKSVTARSLVGLVGGASTVTSDTFTIDGLDARSHAEAQWRTIRGRHIGFVLQDALGSLDPFRKVGDEIAEPLRIHDLATADELDARVERLLSSVGVPEPEIRRAQYPHQLSGGLRQRALIASALAADPALLIADEPTTALDVTVQAQILELLERRKAGDTALLLISHDLAVVSRIADHLYVMKDGEFVESGPTRQVLDDPQHAYTRQLLAAIPSEHARGTRLSPGSGTGPIRRPPVSDRVVLEGSSLRKTFHRAHHADLVAVDDVSLQLHAGETLGIVGESGSGKSTLARLLLALEAPDAGSVAVDGTDWATIGPRRTRAQRRRIQVVQQDPLSSFDPRYSVARIIAEPLLAARQGSRKERADRVSELIVQVGLDPALLSRRARQLSGGQRQRVAIARALATRPEVIVCDEPVSALDVSIQAQVLDLLADLQAELGISYVFISHHLGVIHHVSDRVLVMKDGRAVETGAVDQVFRDPQHPYTRELIAAIPTLDTAETPRAAVSVS
jgi:peptide/nickel transport system ATP-binding protein